MRAAVVEAFGGPERLAFSDVDAPSPRRGEVLLRVRAAALNPVDPKLRRGELRFLFRLKPPYVPGLDAAGEIASLGDGVSRFAVGDAVLAGLSAPGAMAEYVAVPERLLVRKPPGLSFEEAAALPTAGMSALQLVRDLLRLRAGQRLLVNGAGGGVGTLAVSLAKTRDAHVTAVASASKRDVVLRLGADAFVDYSREDFAAGAGRFDAVLDAVPSRSFPECRRVLAPGGVYATTLPGAGPLLWSGFTAVAPFAFGDRRCRCLMLKPRVADLEQLVRLADEGRVRPVVAEVFPLSAYREAEARMASGHACGKIVVTP